MRDVDEHDGFVTVADVVQLLLLDITARHTLVADKDGVVLDDKAVALGSGFERMSQRAGKSGQEG